MLIHGVTEDKKGLRVLRARNDNVEAGEVRPLVEGQPITSDVVRLKPRPEAPFVCDVETEVSVGTPKVRGSKASMSSASTPHRSGPAQVANRAYRDNWDAIWASPSAASPSDRRKMN